ncbi:MAG: ABC transporter ATP-binding protein [Clostridiales Family XIII bacterium]|jgi:peptide/nickel transport system ATP-binding protein|nr:ABC transporter ATP-binding protein [Clostridiales Family XIII bacterium]
MQNGETQRGELLRIRDLVVEYTSEGETIHAVNGVSLELKKGKTLGLLGETGAGKTTIAKSVMRILPETTSKINSGEIYLNGKDVLLLSEKKMRAIRGKSASMIFQDPMTALDPVRRVGEQIEEVIRLHNNTGKNEAQQWAMEMLETVGIKADRAREYPHQFSGGMKQRVVIAIALACKPELLLADEPTTALDVTIQAQILRMIEKLKKELDMSMLLITHDLGVVASQCDDVAVIYAGEILESGSREDIYDHPTHPYTRGLFDALPDINKEVRRLTPITGRMIDPTDLPKGCYFQPRCAYAKKSCRHERREMAEISPGHHCRCTHFA